MISAAATTELEVFVSCPWQGAILVEAVTRGSDAGVAGYAVSIEGISTKTFPIGANESILVPEGELPEGSPWFVELTGIPDHCRVDRQPDRVGELKGNTVRIEYAVVCIPRGSRIAYAYENTINVTGGADEANLGVSDASFPSLTPDRTRVAFSKSRDLFVADVDGGGETRPPDGTLIAYAGGMGGNWIWMVEIDAGRFGEPFPYRLGSAPSWR